MESTQEQQEEKSAEGGKGKGKSSKGVNKSASTSAATAPIHREVCTINFGQIQVDEAVNCRSEYQGIDDLAASIAKDGLITPLTVVKRPGSGDNGDAIYDLLSGFRRYKALKLIKYPKTSRIPVTIRELPEGEGAAGDLAISNLVENTARAEVHPADLAAALTRLEDEHGKSRREIAEKTTLSNSYIGNLIRAQKQLCDDLLRAWRRKDLPTNFINAVSKLEEEKQIEALDNYLALKEEEAKLGRKNKKRTKSGTDEAGEEDEDADTGAVWRSRNDIAAEMESIREKIDNASASDANLLKQQLKALRWVAGEISRLSL